MKSGHGPPIENAIIEGGILSSTFLTLLVLAALYRLAGARDIED
jgi:Cu/Ag efflux pump CusA